MSKFVTCLIAFGVLVSGFSESIADTASATDQAAPTSDVNQGAGKLRVAAAETPHVFQGPREALIEGETAVDIMEVGMPPRAQELALRLQQAVQADPEWWAEVVKQATPGEPLPYDSKFGLTEAEYQEFLGFVNNPGVIKTGEGTLTIYVDDDGQFLLDGGEKMPELTGIAIDLQRNIMRTQYGVADEFSEIHAPENLTTDTWNGVQWKLEDVAPDGLSGVIAKLAIGKTEDTGRLIMYYDINVVSAEGNQRISYILFYDKQ